MNIISVIGNIAFESGNFYFGNFSMCKQSSCGFVSKKSLPGEEEKNQQIPRQAEKNQQPEIVIIIISSTHY